MTDDKKAYGRGDIILVSNNPKPQNNREQKGQRPWLVVSDQSLNENGPVVWAIPFTSTSSNYPLVFDWTSNVPGTRTKGSLLCDQLTTLDVEHRPSRFLEHVTVPEQVYFLIQVVLGLK